ncbi:MAG: PqqD family protein [Phenylobacterium sp.]
MDVAHADQIDGDFAPAVAPSVSSVELEGEAVLYDEATETVHRLNPTAALAWACFDGSATIDELASDMAAVFGADEASVQADLVVLCRRLGGLGLLAGVAANTAKPAGETA